MHTGVHTRTHQTKILFVIRCKTKINIGMTLKWKKVGQKDLFNMILKYIDTFIDGNYESVYFI
jgi:hypothetical protein